MLEYYKKIYYLHTTGEYMSLKTSIEWTEHSWNPITGCDKISEGCKNCYAEKLSNRLYAMGQPKYQNKFHLTLHENSINEPLRWKKPSKIFVCSMSDIFHKDVPFDFIDKIFNTMEQANWHIFQVLTKRSDRLLEYSKRKIVWPKNVWAGVTVENDKNVYRINNLLQVNCNIRFISFEPLLGDIPYIDLNGIQWVICGGESGTNARPMDVTWARHIRDMVKQQNIPFFFKQWGGINKQKTGKLLDGQEWLEFPKI